MPIDRTDLKMLETSAQNWVNITKELTNLIGSENRLNLTAEQYKKYAELVEQNTKAREEFISLVRSFVSRSN